MDPTKPGKHGLTSPPRKKPRPTAARPVNDTIPQDGEVNAYTASRLFRGTFEAIGLRRFRVSVGVFVIAIGVAVGVAVWIQVS